MKFSISLLMLLLTFNLASAQDTCKVLGQRNPHGASMTISGPMIVADSVNFSVVSTKALPYNIGPADTIFFNVCIRARDGKAHSSQIRYNTTHGPVSYTFTMTAPTSSSVPTMVASSDLVTVWPNPARSIAHFLFPGSSEIGALELFSASGAKVYSAKRGVVTDVAVPVAELPNGVYTAITTLVGDKKYIARFIVAH